MSINDYARVGEEVTCLIAPWLIEESERRGTSREQLLAGVDYPIEHLYDKSKRIDWDSMRTIYANMGKYFSDEELVDIGTTSTEANVFRYLIALVRLLYSTREFYRWSLLEQFPQYNRALTTRVVEPQRSRMVFEYQMKSGYSNCREIALIIGGQLTVFPVVLGLPPAEVGMELLEDGAIYEIRFEEGGGPLSWVRRIARWPFTVRATAQELIEAHSLLQRRYNALESEIQARAEAEAAGAHIRDDEQARIQLYLSGTLARKVEDMQTAVVALADTLEPEYAVERDLVETMNRACKETRQEIEEVARVLSPSDISAGFVESLQGMCDRMRAQSSVDIRLTGTESVVLPPAPTRDHLFHIAQEAITNALRHGSPSRIEIDLRCDDNTFDLVIVDDGVGFVCSEPRYNRMGIELMRRRAELIGASLDIESAVGQGAKVCCTLEAAHGS